MLLLAPRSILLVALVLLAPIGAARADTIANWPADWSADGTYQGGWGEPIPFVSPTPLPYFGQTFTAPDGTLDSLQLMFQARDPGISNVGDSIFHLVILEFAGDDAGQSFEPLLTCNSLGLSDVCFESADLVVPLALANTDVPMVIPLDGLALNPGQEYFFLLDAWVTRDGVGSDIGIGTYHPFVGNMPGSGRAMSVSSSETSATRQDHFYPFPDPEQPRQWNNISDLAYVLSYTPVPEPATGALCALGLAAIALARRSA